MHFTTGAVTVVGTSHVSEESVKEIQRLMEEEYAAVGVELDPNRLIQLGSKERPSFHQLIGRFGFRIAAFAAFAAWVQGKVGRIVGLDPGSDMLEAVRIAERKHIPVICVDQDITITLRRLRRHLDIRFAAKIMKDAVTGLIRPGKIQKQLGIRRFDLKRVPSDRIVQQILGLMEQEYPGMYHVLVEERNHAIVRNIREMRKHFDGPILIVVGAGHVKGIRELLKSEVPHIDISLDGLAHSDPNYSDPAIDI